MDLKVAAENLLKVADLIEKEAEQKTIFACESCNHTVTLAEINATRKSFAEKEASDTGKPVHVAKITVNDKVACGSCGEGAMCYEADEVSSKYWVEAAEEDDLETLDIAEEDDTEVPEKEEDKEEDKEDSDTEEDKDTDEDTDDEDKELPDDLFEPVDEQDEKKKEEEEVIDDTEKEPTDEGDVADEETDTEETDTEEVEEEPKPKPKKKKTKKDSPTDGKANVNKEPPPKFEKMPKEASDRFWSSVSRYSI